MADMSMLLLVLFTRLFAREPLTLAAWLLAADAPGLALSAGAWLRGRPNGLKRNASDSPLRALLVGASGGTAGGAEDAGSGGV